MATTFKYADQSDLKNYFNNFGDYDSKVQVYPKSYSLNLAVFQDTGYADGFFVNGDEKTKVGDTPNSNGEFRYYADDNYIQYFDSTLTTDTVFEQVYETGVDFETFINQVQIDCANQNLLQNFVLSFVLHHAES